jgi:NADH dehydrogenase FAD-containing subunit
MSTANTAAAGNTNCSVVDATRRRRKRWTRDGFGGSCREQRFVRAANSDEGADEGADEGDDEDEDDPAAAAAAAERRVVLLRLLSETALTETAAAATAGRDCRMDGAAKKKKPTVVVVGGQFAGRRAARLLRRGGEFDITLVDAKGFWEYTPGALRCLVEPGAARRMVQPQPAGTLTAAAVGFGLSEEEEEEEGGGEGGGGGGNGKMKTVTSVELSDGTRLPAEYVVLATGSSYASPIKAAHDRASCAEERRDDIAAAHGVLESAPSVLIIGGGTVGVELAAEIVGVWGRAKAVTLVTPNDGLLDRMPARAGKLAAEWLRRKGVRIIMNDRIEDWGGAPRGGAAPEPSGGKWTLRTERGQELHASLVYPCIGGRPCAEPAKRAVPSALGPRGEVTVNDTFRVEGLRNVFAVGDCCGTAEEKSAFTADLNATAVAANITASHRGDSVLPAYPRAVCGTDTVPSISVVSLYKWSAVMQFNKLVIAGPLPAFVKWLMETLQVQSARGTFGCTALWDFVEVTALFLARFLFVTTPFRDKAAAAAAAERSLASELRTTAAAVAVGVAGALAGTATGAALPWMLGSMASTSLASLAGVRLTVWGPLKTTMQAVIGVSLGAQFTPEMLLNIYNNGLPSMLGLVLFTACAAAASSWYLARVAGYDPTTAFFAGAPGGGSCNF